MEKMTNFLSWLKTLPIWQRVLALLAMALIVLIASMSLSACGTLTSATIRNIQPNTNTQIHISNQNSQNTEVNTTAEPNVSITN